MSSTYPTTLDSLVTTRADSDATATNHVADHNDANDAINKIEAELGVLPKGTFSNVVGRLNARGTLRISSDQSFTTTTLANVTNMSIAVAASSDYYFKFCIPVTLGVACGAGVAVTCPASPTGLYYRMAIGNVTATTETIGFGFASAAAITTAASATTNAIILVEGVLSNGANAGTLQLQLKRGSGATGVNVVAKKGGYGEWYIN